MGISTIIRWNSDVIEESIVRIADQLLKPRVLHSLPGRVRIHLPLLKRADRDSIPLGEAIAAAERVLPGVKRIAPSLVSGNILIEYDVSVTSESTILATIRTITKSALRHRDRFFAVAPESRKTTLDKLVEYFGSIETERLEREEELVLPDEIWS